MSLRYAIYWVPSAEHALWRAGCTWLGRDPTEPVTAPAPALRGAPWRYGFHATLKAPMRLKPGVSQVQFCEALAVFTAKQPRFAMPGLQLAWLNHFLALRPAQTLDRAHPLWRLADACVQDMDVWRATPNANEQLRFQNDTYTAAEQRAALQYGYAYVLEQWRFHMTLSDSLGARQQVQRQTIEQRARSHFTQALAEPLHCTELALFVESQPLAPLRLVQRFLLRGALLRV